MTHTSTRGHDRPLLGAHISAAGGLVLSIGRAQAMGAECMQIFGASPRQWHARVPSADESEEFKAALKKSMVKAVYLHGAYLVNLASESAEQRKNSIESLSNHLRIVQAIGANGLIFHMGSAKDRARGIELTIEGIDAVLKNVPGEAYLVMENSAGGGSKLGSTMADLEDIYLGLKSKFRGSSKRLKICIDTAHTFGSGLVDDFTPAKIKKFADDVDAQIGIENVVAMHINDSKADAHTNVDRHENLGEGKIGLAGFRALAAEKRFAHMAWMMEVPGFANEGPDKENLDILRGCFKS